MADGCQNFTRELARFANDQRELVSRQELVPLLQAMFDDLKQNTANAISANIDNMLARAVNVHVTSRNERLAPIFSVVTGERIEETGKTINELAALQVDALDDLLRTLGLPTTGSYSDKKQQLSRAMGLIEYL
ncbi:hypothetical protein MAPG_03700 [Magnaporthiopsis poae ATCC 64411]|uniref:Uncharacterized protein n=1 Tax=Magnaporthiopsis poae (strain ATCC 64411 / 73-15) TaxID=644358 RepID=A0A0C4DUQ8_MAGP6|nr:hypothetical protein MAPG_03700 [Magnaporthiopsis poae ATCC 64411]